MIVRAMISSTKLIAVIGPMTVVMVIMVLIVVNCRFRGDGRIVQFGLAHAAPCPAESYVGRSDSLGEVES